MEILLEIYDCDSTNFRMEISKNLALVVYQLNKSGLNARFQNGGFVNKYVDDYSQGFRLVVNRQHILKSENNFNMRNQVFKDEDIEPMRIAILEALNSPPCNYRL